MASLAVAIRESLADLKGSIRDDFADFTAYDLCASIDALAAVLDLCDKTIWILNANEVRAAIAEKLGVSDG